MNLLLIVLLLILALLSFNSTKLPNARPLGAAWLCAACIAFTEVFAALFRAGNLNIPRDLALAECWASAFQWLFLGAAIVNLGNAFRGPSQTHP